MQIFVMHVDICKGFNKSNVIPISKGFNKSNIIPTQENICYFACG